MFRQATISIFLLCTAAAGGVALAQPVSPPAVETMNEPVRIIADSINYDRRTGVYSAQGNVEIYWGNRILKADMARFYEQTKFAQATGNVFYTEDEGTLRGDYLEVNFETKQALLKDGDLFYRKENLSLSGTSLEKLSEDHYILEQGDITTCEGDSPPWKVSYKKADVTVNGWAKVTGATFKVKDIPLLYSPYLLFPAKAERQTGLLIPSFGFSSSEGAYLNNQFFWAISENTDATFYLDTATEKGLGVGSEYRYINSEDDYGRLYGYFASESGSYQDEEYGETEAEKFDREESRWNLIYEGHKDFNENLFLRAKVDLVSDRQFYKDYGYQTVLRTAERVESSVFLTKHWDQGFSLVGDVEYNKDLLEDFQKQSFFDDPNIGMQDLLDEDPVGRYPKVFFTGLPHLLGGTPLYARVESTYNNFSRDEGTEGSRADLNPIVSWPLVFSKHFLFETEAGLRETMYLDTHNREEGEDSHDNRTLYSIGARLSTKFMKVFSSKDNPQRRYRHTIEPEISYVCIPDRNQDDLPVYDAVDRITEQNRFALAFTNRLMAKLFHPDNTTAETEILFIRAGQYYDASTSDDPFSNFFLELRTRPATYVYVKSDFDYDVYDSELEAFNALLDLRNRRGDYFSIEYRYALADDEQPDTIIDALTDTFLDIEAFANERINADVEAIITSAGLALTNSLTLFGANRQTLDDDRSLETIVGLNYQAQCWGTMLTYRSRAATDGRQHENAVGIQFFLKGVGKVGGFGM